METVSKEYDIVGGDRNSLILGNISASLSTVDHVFLLQTLIFLVSVLHIVGVPSTSLALAGCSPINLQMLNSQGLVLGSLLFSTLVSP